MSAAADRGRGRHAQHHRRAGGAAGVRWATGASESVPSPDDAMNQDSPRLRLSVLGVVVFALFASLFARLWYLQVMVSDEFQVEAQSNRTRTVPVEAPRGRILDRNGKVLVDNRISVQVTIDRTILRDLEEEERTAVLARLADGLAQSGMPTTVQQLEERVADQRYSPYVPVPVAGDVPEELKIWIDEHADDLPSVAADRVAVRRYPYGRLAAHVLGYAGKITKEEFDAKATSPKPYTLNDEIGKYGIEKVYEDDLRGSPGVDAPRGRRRDNPIRVVPEGTTRHPRRRSRAQHRHRPAGPGRAGAAVRAGASAPAARAAGDGAPNVGKVGSTVVLDPKSGGVLAMASFPTFAPSDFVDGISENEWALLTDPENHYPAEQLGPPGPVRAGLDLQAVHRVVGARTPGLVTPESTVNDTGIYEVPGCSRRLLPVPQRQQQGRTASSTSAARSPCPPTSTTTTSAPASGWSRTTLGGPERFAELLERWGFYSDTGIDLTGRAGGPHPVAGVAHLVLRADRVQRGRRQLAHRQQRQHGDRAGRRPGHAAPARRRVRHPRQRRRRCGSPRSSRRCTTASRAR